MPTSDADAARVLERFVGLLMEPASDSPWDDGFPSGQHVRARSLYFLLHRGRETDAQGFVTETLERLLGQLVCRTERETVTYQGRIRGQVVWPLTLKSRHTGDCDRTRFVCRDVRRRFDTPENQLLKFVVETIARDLETVPPSMRGGRCYYPISRQTSHETTGARLDRMSSVLARLRRHVRLREVSLPGAISEEHVRRARASKAEEYGLAAELYLRYRAAVLSPGWGGVARLSRSVLVFPPSPDGEGAAWLRLAAGLLRRAGRDQTSDRRTAGSPRIT